VPFSLSCCSAPHKGEHACLVAYGEEEKSTNETGKNICKTSEEIERFTVDEIKHFSD